MPRDTAEVDHELQIFAESNALAKGASDYVAALVCKSVAATGRFNLAMSGGTTPWAMLSELAQLDLPWENIAIYQVDERIVPAGDSARNLTHLENCLQDVHPNIVKMPVDDTDLEKASAHYGIELPERFDLIHLGLGADGHTASLIPGDRILAETDRPIAISGEYEGHRRMTFTYPTIARADQILWLVTGSDKQWPLSMLLNGDTSIPAGRVRAARSLIMADRAAR